MTLDLFKMFNIICLIFCSYTVQCKLIEIQRYEAFLQPGHINFVLRRENKNI